ncbi:hypothetical protein [Natronorubrum texcoconense]|uniref:Uncharacterized protein n=1 Tax=Natronorubrum texcoconense TaxID=1095776 RepID=A0A1G9BGF1_9EURY|nr:hypothetical protein [Natronorubrum texcoconense]SDK38592.1 hypothetical protein SAMN04515672_2949 [Natronorubrum texcoconense]
MRTPRSRRALLSAVLPFSMAFAGCFEEQLTSADDPESEFISEDEYDCADIDRPEPEDPVQSHGLESMAYPSPSDPLTDAEAFAREFEEAYRHNGFLEEYGSATRVVSFSVRDSELERIESNLESESEMEAVLVSIVYDLSTETQRGTPTNERGSRVSYYVDDHVALRSRYQHGIASEPDPFDPDPRDAGTAVVCFD